MSLGPPPPATDQVRDDVKVEGRIRPPQQAWVWGFLLIFVWTALLWGGSWWLIRQSYQHTLQQQMLTQAQTLAQAVHAELLMRSPAPASQPATLPASLNTYLGDPALQQLVTLAQQHLSAFHHVPSYIILWDHAVIVAHSHPDLVGQTLPGSSWSTLPPDTSYRISEIHDLPWENALLDKPVPGKIGDRAKSPPEYWDVTLKLPSADGFISVGLQSDPLLHDFWTTQRDPLRFSAIAAVICGVFLWLIMWYGRFQRKQAWVVQEQHLRARTSLLTERGMLASILAHEVRSPLTALRFNLHSLRSLLVGSPRGRLSAGGTQVETDHSKLERQIELTELCEREIRRLDLMLNDFLTHTQVIGPPAHTPVNQVVHEALDFLRPALEKRHIRILTHLDDSQPIVGVNADELRQVLLNLAANAQDAMTDSPLHRSSEPTLIISTVAEENAITLLVRDNGPGISAELQHRIFEPFFTTKPQGSGLGLALVRRVISGAGGTVFCESVPGSGTTFRIVLPLALPLAS